MHIFKNSPAFFLLAASIGMAHAAPLRDIDVAGLSESKVATLDVSKPGSAGKSYLAATIIGAPLPALCSIILDFPQYPAFMPNTAKTAVVESAANVAVIDMTLNLPLGKIKKYRLKMESTVTDAMCRLSWKLVPRADLKPDDTIADTTGYWLFVPLAGDAAKTVAKYFVYSDPGPVPLGLGWIVDAMGKDSLPKTLEALRNKALPETSPR